MRRKTVQALCLFRAILASIVSFAVCVGGAHAEAYPGPTQVVTVYFAGTLLKADTTFGYGGETPAGRQQKPELLQYLYYDQDVSDPNQHRVWVDGIGNDARGPFDAGLAARHANNCRTNSKVPDPWDPTRQVPYFRSAWGVHLAGFECWDYRLHEALDTNTETDLFRIMDANRDSPVILNILGHSRGGILAMMLAHKVSRLQRRYDASGDLKPEHERFVAINIITFDPVPGNTGEIGLFGEDDLRFHASHEYFGLGPKVTHYVGFYAKDERQNIFEAVVPHVTEGTTAWLLAFNGAHQTLVGNPRRDGHKYGAVTSQDYSQPLALGSIRGYHSAEDQSATDVGIVTSIIARELLATDAWGNVKFKTSWRANDPGLHYGSANCEDDEQSCERFFMERYRSHESMPAETRATMRSVANPRHSFIIPEGGLQGWDFERDACSIRITDHRQFSALGTDHGKCTLAAPSADGNLMHTSLIDRTPDLVGTGMSHQSGQEVCRRLVELTRLPWSCTL